MMQQNFELFRSVLIISTVVFFASMIQSVTGVLTDIRLDFRRLQVPWGLIFQHSGLQLSLTRPWRSQKTCHVGACALGRLSF